MISRQTLLAPFLTLALALPAAAGAPKVTVQADRKDAQVGQPVLVTLRVRGAVDMPTVKPSTVAGAQIVQVGQPTSVPTLAAELEGQGIFHAGGGRHLVNALRGLGQMPNVPALDPDLAKMFNDPNLLKGAPAVPGLTDVNSNDYLFTYQITPERSGMLTVPGFSVNAGGQALTSSTLSLNVSEAKPQPWVEMRLSLSNPTPAVGEEVQLNVDLLIQRKQVNYAGKTYEHLPVSKMSLALPALDGTKQIELVEPLEQLVREKAIEPGKRGYRVNNLPGEVKLEHEPADGKGAGLDPARYRRRLTIPLRLREGGQVTLAAAHAAGEVYVPTGNKGTWEPFVVSSEPLTFSILDLRRRADRPADFSGAMGEVRVTAKASQTEMPAGTPFTLTVYLQGNGSVATTAAPDLAGKPEFANRFRVRTEEARTAPGGRTREFTYTLRPLSEAVTEVPSISVSYFDPKANKFGIAHSEPIPLRVTAAQNATPDAPPAPPPPPAPADEVQTETASLGDSLWPWVEGAMAVALVACAAVWGWRRLRRPNKEAAIPPPQPELPALPRPHLERLAPGPTFDGLRQSLQEFLRRHFGVPPGEVTPYDAECYLIQGGVKEGLARSFAAVLETCETAEFAPGIVSTTPSELEAYARRLKDEIVAALPEVVV
jgi:hypothetical protein